MHTERKSGRFYAASIFAGVLLISALSACIQSLGSNDGMAQIVISEPGRQAIAPQWSSTDIVSYTLYGSPSGQSNYTGLLTFFANVTSPSLSLTAGIWDFSLAARNSEGITFLSADIYEIELVANQVTTLLFTLKETQAGSGNAAISVVLPIGHQALRYLVRLDPPLDPQVSPEPTAIPAAPSGEPTTVSFNQGLAAGEYDIAFEFFNSAGTLILRVGERLWIRDNLTSSHTFNPALTEFGSAPLAPTGLNASYIPGSGGVLRVNWTDNSNNETAFILQINSESPISTGSGVESTLFTDRVYGEDLTISLFARNSFGDSGIETKTLQLPWLVQFDSNGGSMLRPVEVYHGLQLSAPTPPTKADHSFAGWYHEALLTNEFDFSNETITADRTLYAKWITDTVYVSSTGDDTSGDGSKALPFATITHALSVLDSYNVPQGTVRIAAGYYDESFIPLSISSGRRLEGGWNTDFTIRSYKSSDGYGVNSSLYTTIAVPISFEGTEGLGSSLSGLEITTGEISDPEYLVQIASECTDPISIEWCTINLSGTGSTTAARAVYAQALVPLSISNCNISVDSYAVGPYGIDSAVSQTKLYNNKITANSGGGTFDAVTVNVSAGTLLANSNYIQNQSGSNGNALRIAGVSEAAVFNNYIESDYATTVSYSATDAEPLWLFNNVIKAQYDPTDAIALNATTANFNALIANNIIIANTSAGTAINFSNPEGSTNTKVLYNDISGFTTLLSINEAATTTDIATLNTLTTEITASGNTTVFVEANSFDTNSSSWPLLLTTAPLGLRNGGLDLSVSGDLNSLSAEIQTLAVKDAFGTYRSGEGTIGWSMGLHEQDWRNTNNTVLKAGPDSYSNQCLIDHSAGSIIRHEMQGTDLTNMTYYLTTGAAQVKGNGMNLPLYSTYTNVYIFSGNFTTLWTIDLTNELGELKTYTFSVLADGFTSSGNTWYSSDPAWFENGSNQLQAPTIGRGQRSSVERIYFSENPLLQYISFERELSASDISHLEVEVFMGGSSTDSLAAWGIDISQRQWTGTVASASNYIDLSGRSVTYPLIVRFTWYKDDQDETVAGNNTAYLQNIFIMFTS